MTTYSDFTLAAIQAAPVLFNREASTEKACRLIQEATSRFGVKEFVAFHPSWSYFARRYGLSEVGIIQQSPGRDPTPRQIEEIIAAVRRYHIRAVFAEPQFNSAAARAIAEEAGVAVLILDPLGGPDRPGRDSYIALMRHNLEIIKEAML